MSNLILKQLSGFFILCIVIVTANAQANQQSGKSPSKDKEASSKVSNTTATEQNSNSSESKSESDNSNRVFKQSEVTQKVRVLSKPEAAYTEEARKDDVTGVVRLRAILAASGHVKNISVVNALPYGLTEKAIEAARHLKFTPAMKDDHPVSVYVTLEYEFDLIYNETEVTRKALVTFQPPPQYTETARQHHVSGTVVLAVILKKSGEVNVVEVLKELPDGLTEQAIAAARQIKFEPALRKEIAVSQYAKIAYDFKP